MKNLKKASFIRKKVDKAFIPQAFQNVCISSSRLVAKFSSNSNSDYPKESQNQNFKNFLSLKQNIMISNLNPIQDIANSKPILEEILAKNISNSFSSQKMNQLINHEFFLDLVIQIENVLQSEKNNQNHETPKWISYLEDLSNQKSNYISELKLLKILLSKGDFAFEDALNQDQLYKITHDDILKILSALKWNLFFYSKISPSQNKYNLIDIPDLSSVASMNLESGLALYKSNLKEFSSKFFAMSFNKVHEVTKCSYKIGLIYKAISEKLFDNRELENSKFYFKKAKEFLNASDTPCFEELLEIEVCLANINFSEEKISKAIKSYLKCSALLEKSNHNISLLATTYHNLAICYIEEGQQEKGLKYLNKESDLLRIFSSSPRASILNKFLRAKILKENDIENAVKELILLLIIHHEDLEHQTDLKIIVISELVYCLQTQKKYQESVGFLLYLKELAIGDDSLSLQVHQKLASSYKSMNLLEDSLASLQTILNIHRQAGSIFEVIETYNKIGFIHQGLGNMSKSLESFENALNMCNQGFPDKHQTLSTLHQNIGYVYQNLRMKTLAEHHYENAINSLLKIVDEKDPSVKLVYQSLYTLYAENDDQEKMKQVKKVLSKLCSK